MAAEHEAHEARRGARSAWLALVAFAAMLAASIRTVSPPAPLPADAPEDVFSAVRAFPHVSVIAAEPHPLGSPRHGEVLAYILDQMRAVGVE
ncbi:MAG TPA: peptidase, partial [Planctomycetota bacterium]|nr:peptidase [Planctomycetota bacterium]